MSGFKVGDIVTIIDAGGPISLEARDVIGMEAEVLALPGEFATALYHDDHRLGLRGGRVIIAREKYLRKRHPPEQPCDTQFLKVLDRWMRKTETQKA